MVDLRYLSALEAERTRVLRHRLVWYCAIAAGLISLSLAANLLELRRGSDTEGERQATLLDTASDLALMVSFLVGLGWVGWRRPPRLGLVRVLTVLWIVVGSIAITTQPIANALSIGVDNPEYSDAQRWIAAALAGFTAVFVLHFVGSLLIPLSWREAMTPVLILWVVASGIALVVHPTSLWWVKVLAIATFPLTGLPGVWWSWMSYQRLGERFHSRVLGEKYAELSSELVYARRIHESLFPVSLERGPVKVAYHYEPMRDIGGDFLFIHPSAYSHGAGLRPVSIVLIDVSGHGVPAALAVNRLHGELQRYFQSTPGGSPGALLGSLNAYTFAALAPQGVYAAAFCIRVDAERRRIEWAAAGHPPAILRRPDGALEWMEATAPMLGVLEPEAFDADERSASFEPGCAALAFTDGVTEARTGVDKMLGPEGVLRAIREGAEGTALRERVMAGVRRARGDGPPDDDALVVEVHHAQVYSAVMPMPGAASEPTRGGAGA